jgi:hypothetical protein
LTISASWARRTRWIGIVTEYPSARIASAIPSTDLARKSTSLVRGGVSIARGG